MLIVADQVIPYVRDSFSTIGEVRAIPSGEITAETVRDADILLVRSVTRVDEALLAGSRVRFVGTATIGFDHVDRDCLERRGIGFASAPGCNADAVADYVTAALLVLHKRGIVNMDSMKLGVVGVGSIGGRVVERARGLGVTVLQNDPPKATTCGTGHCFLHLDALMDCDVVTLHVPLTTGGPFPTRGLFDAGRLSRMKKGSVLINTCRGPVVDGNALKQALARDLGGTVLDVWEHEPEIDTGLLDMVDIGTSHIAGLSLEGRANGNTMLYRAACRHFGLPERWRPSLPEPEVPRMEVYADREDIWAELQNAVSAVYDIAADDELLRKLFVLPAENRGRYFTELRQGYRRRELGATRVSLDTADDALRDRFRAAGFPVD